MSPVYLNKTQCKLGVDRHVGIVSHMKREQTCIPGIIPVAASKQAPEMRACCRSSGRGASPSLPFGSIIYARFSRAGYFMQLIMNLSCIEFISDVQIFMEFLVFLFQR